MKTILILMIMIFSLSIFGSDIDSLKTTTDFNLTKNEFKNEFINLKLSPTPNKDIKLKTAALVGYPVLMTVMALGYSSASNSKQMQSGAFIGTAVVMTVLFIYVVASN